VVKTTTTRTEKYEGANAGGKAREKAEAKGDKEVQVFERAVQKLVRRMGVCPLGQPWYNMKSGYLCAEGIHFLYHKDIDMSFERPGWIPEATYVNTFDDPSVAVSGTVHGKHPPPIDFHQPIHLTHRNFIRECLELDVVSNSHGPRSGGCECAVGLRRRSPTVNNRVLRRNGFDPDASRHAMLHKKP
jgi:hypothetical protein